MKHLFFVSVALGIFSGTTTSTSAQTTVNSTRGGDAVSVKKSEKFIEGIEIRPGTMGPDKPVVIKKPAETIAVSYPVPDKKSVSGGIENCTAIQFKYAQLMNMDVESITNYTLYQFIENWWATRYQYGGSSKEGVDCSAYSASLLHDVYGLDISQTARSQYAECRKIKKKNLLEGDLVFFKTGRGVSHVGVYLRDGYFTHASVSNGVTVSNLDEPYYSKRYIGGGRINVNETE